MKLVIQIPCYNEEETLPITLQALPKQIEGIDSIEVLVIDDGSTDKTVDVAKEFGIKNFVIHPYNKGFGKTFSSGISKALELGADIIVSTDGDNQYCADDIEKLVIPLLKCEADIVIGERPIMKIKHFSPIKKCLQKLGTFVVKILSSANITDATSGFRAFTREAAMQLNLFETYSPMMETTFQAVAKGLKIKQVPIRVNPVLRESRLIKSIYKFIIIQSYIILRNFIIYRPVKFFIGIAFIFLIISLVFAVLYYQLHKNCFVIISVISILTGLQSLLLSLFAVLFSFTRKMLETIKVTQKEQLLKDNSDAYK